MSPLIRRFLFYLFVFFFIIISAFLALYALGWTIDIRHCYLKGILNCPIQRKGAIFVETDPRGVTIAIDGITHEDKSSIIESGTLITNLLPGIHDISVKKDGYRSWEKSLAVLPGRVSEAMYIILVPQEIKLQTESFSVRGNKIEAVNARGSAIIIKNSETNTYYLHDKTASQSVLNISLLAKNLTKENIRAVNFNPLDAATLIIQTDKNLLLIDIKNLTTSGITAKPASWSVDQGIIYYVNEVSSSTITSFNLVNGAKNIFKSLAKKINSPIETFEIANDKLAFKTSKKELFLAIDDKPIKIDDQVESFGFSPDRKKLAYMSGDKIKVYFINDWTKGTRKKAGEAIIIEPKEEAYGFSWHNDSYHLIPVYGKSPDLKAELVEIDDRTPVNRYEIASGASDIVYHGPTEQIFFIQNNNLFRFPI